LPHRVHKTGLHLEQQPLFFPAQFQPAVVHPRIDGGVLVERQRSRQRLYHEPLGQNLQPVQPNLRVGNGAPLHRDDGFRRQAVQILREFRMRGLFNRNLRLARAVAQHQKRHGARIAHAFHKPLHLDFGSRDDLIHHRSFHILFSFSSFRSVEYETNASYPASSVCRIPSPPFTCR
jgi:hypothetical protein